MKKQLFFYNFLLLKNIFLKKVTVNALPLNFLVRNYVDKNKNLFLIDNFSTFFNFKILKKKKLKSFIKKKKKLGFKTKWLNLFNLINYLHLRKKRKNGTAFNLHWKKLLKETNKKYANTNLSIDNRIETKKKFAQYLLHQDRLFFLKKIQKHDIQKITSYSLLKKIKTLLLSFLFEDEIKKIFDKKLLEKGTLKPILFLEESDFKKFQESLDSSSSRILVDGVLKHPPLKTKVVQAQVTALRPLFQQNKKKLQKKYSLIARNTNISNFQGKKLHTIKQNSIGSFIALNSIAFLSKNNFNFSFNYYQKFFTFKKIQYLKTIISTAETIKKSVNRNKNVILSNKNIKGYTKAYLSGLLVTVKTPIIKKKKIVVKSQVQLNNKILYPISQKELRVYKKKPLFKTFYISILKKIPFFFKKIVVPTLYTHIKKPKINDVLETFSNEKKLTETKILNFKLYTTPKKNFFKKKKKSKIYLEKKKKKIIKKIK